MVRTSRSTITHLYALLAANPGGYPESVLVNVRDQVDLAESRLDELMQLVCPHEDQVQTGEDSWMCRECGKDL